MLGSQVLARAIDPLLGAPPGEEPNFINPYSRGQRIVISSIILTSFAFVFVLARVFVKGFITKRFGWDDVFCVAAMVMPEPLDSWVGNVGIHRLTGYSLGLLDYSDGDECYS